MIGRGVAGDGGRVQLVMGRGVAGIKGGWLVMGQ